MQRKQRQRERRRWGVCLWNVEWRPAILRARSEMVAGFFPASWGHHYNRLEGIANDRQRKNPQLRVSRTQFPLAPAFAITAHVAQGQTITEGVLCVGLGGNPFTAYVAFTRVQGRTRLFIYRAFDAAPFQKGIGLGRDLLLRQLRGERIEWKALLAKYCEERTCGACAERKPATALTAGQWKRSDADRVCRECTKRHADAGTPWQCNVCKRWHAETNFPDKHRQRQCSFYRVCLTCETKKPCTRCGVAKSEADFGAAAWKARNAERRYCRTCATKMRDHWQPLRGTQASCRILCLAGHARACTGWHATMQHVRVIGVGLSRRSQSESTGAVFAAPPPEGARAIHC